MHVSKFAWIKYHHNVVESTRHFMHKPWAGGVVLLISVAVAMLLANLEWSKHIYHQLLTTDLSLLIHIPSDNIDIIFPKEMNLEKLINDGLMVIFFFCVGLEIKREVMHGELSSPRKAILPVMAAIGGMVVPAIIYYAVNNGTSVELGWGIPMATDIAFAIGILTLLGNRVPISLKIFLTALAIADDLGAIIVIALFYGGSINLTYLSIALAIMLIVLAMNQLGERHQIFYVVPAVAVWSLFYYSGVHATLAGVAMAMLIPSNARYSKQYLFRNTALLATKMSNETDVCSEHYHEYLRQMQRLTKGAVPMSVQLELALAPIVTFIVMPVFALANAGVEIDLGQLNILKYSATEGSIGIGILLGLLFGKPIGITLMSWLAVRFGLAEMPTNSSWKMLFAVATLGGIGFTMSIFIDTLAFFSVNMAYVNQGKIAIIFSSFAAAILGVILILLLSRKSRIK
ncbi:MAG: Na+/H+ antiporter NhaA [Rikenellaceae bacterium]